MQGTLHYDSALLIPLLFLNTRRVISISRSAVLQHKFFDSGDYNMARAKHRLSSAVGAEGQQQGQQEDQQGQQQTKAHEDLLLQEATGVTIATPESVPAVRRKSMVAELGGGANGPLSTRSPRGSLSYPATSAGV